MCAPAGRAIYPSIISRLHHLGRAAAPGILCSALLRHCVHVMRPAYRRQPAALDSLFANDGIPLPRKRPRARSQKKKKIYAPRSSSFRAPPPPWLALLVSPEFSSRVAGPAGRRPWEAALCSCPCVRCVGRYKETVVAVTKIPYKKYNPLRYGLKPNEHVGD